LDSESLVKVTAKRVPKAIFLKSKEIAGRVGEGVY
jgi:hypothetical protein